MLICPIYILFTKKSTHFGLEVSTNFGLRVLAHFGPKENWQNLQRFWNISSLNVPNCSNIHKKKQQIYVWGLAQYGPTKSYKKNLQRFWTISSLQTMCQTILIFPNMYIIHKQNWHIMVWRYWHILAQKIRREKFIKIF